MAHSSRPARSSWLLTGILLSLPAIVQAAETCPWLNNATAGGVLGGAVNVTVTHENANRDDASCVFTHGASELRIAVETMDPPHSEYMKQSEQCGATTAPLKAIGNEAVVCSPDARSARVVGRVRTRIFEVQVTTAGASSAPDLLREKARAVAEQVAGFLF
ncbi:MAG: hypothetical protein ABSB15_13345 [Bryobacteraceae bacterium]|jgi:hypothetical protein